MRNHTPAFVRSLGALLLVTGGALGAATAPAAADPCSTFTWDVSRELAVMKQSPRALTAGDKPGAAVPELQLGQLYEVKLAAQGGVTFAGKPGKPTLGDGTQAGLARVHIDKAGAYRVSITSGHWVDFVDGATVIKSRDFQGQRGCERPHKIVEFDLQGGRDVVLQLSGGSDATVLVAVTAVAPKA